MKVLEINAVYGHGSTGTIVRDIEHMCLSNGIECYVASPDKSVLNSKNGYVIGNTLDHKLHAILCRVNGRQAYFSRLATRALLGYIGRLQPDVVHLHNLHSNYINLNMLLKYLAMNDIRTIVTLHDCWFYTGGCFHYTAVGCDKWLYSCGSCPKKMEDTPAYLCDCSSMILADRKRYLNAIPRLTVTGVSDWMISEGKKTFFGNRECLSIRNGIDLNVFKPTESDLRKRLGLENKYVILGPASKWFLPINRPTLDYFVENMKSDEILLLFGARQEVADLPAKVVSFGYTKDRTELAALYSIADVFVNVTREDSLSLINVEAQACGTPVVTYNQTGPKETVDEINSFSVKVGAMEQLYKKVCLIRQNMTNHKSIRQFVTSNYDLNQTYQDYVSLYLRIVSL